MKVLTVSINRITYSVKNLLNQPMYPILLAWYAILFLFVHNIQELTVDDLLTPLAVTTVLLCATFFVLKYLVKDWHKVALLLGYCVIVFFTHGRLHSMIGENGVGMGSTRIGTDVFLLMMWGALVLLFARLFFIDSVSWQKVSKLSTTVSMFLLAMVIIQIGWFYVSNGGVQVASSEIRREQQTNTTANILADKTQQPDVYYLIFDRYAGGETYEKYYNYSNEPFLHQLEQKGFYIARDSWANYPKTSFSLASSLNLNYIQDLIHADSASAPESSTVFPLLQDHEVGRFLQERGYKYYHIGSWFEGTKHNSMADFSIEPGPNDFLMHDDFVTKLISTTIYPVIERKINSKMLSPDQQWSENHRNWALFQVARLKEVITNISTEPKFVFAHILLPHDPLVVNSTCESLNDKQKKEPEIVNYVRQTECANKLINELVDNIKMNSRQDPIVVVQADEGPSAMVNRLKANYNFVDASEESIEERSHILNAYLLPGELPADINQAITPVNSFRIIFNQYFGANFDLLPDKTYLFISEEELFDMKLAK